MRAVLGFAAVHAVLATVGMAVLFAAGFVTRARQAALALGPAYLCGIAAVMPVLILMLVLGLSVQLPHFVVTSAVLAVGLAAAGVRRLSRREDTTEAAPAQAGAGPRWAARIGAAAVGVYFAVGATAFAKLGTANDDMAIWSYKALTFFHYDGALEPHVIASPGPVHLDYPVLQPLLESIFFRTMGNPHLQEWHIALWILFGCFVWTVAFLLRSAGATPVLLIPAVAVLALTPGSASWIATGYADVTVACFLAAGALAMGLWLEGRPDRYAVVAGLLMAAAANVKNEGTIFSACILVAAAAVLGFTHARRWRGWLAAAALAVAGAAPWAIWRSSRDLADPDLTPLADALDPTFLIDRLDRLDKALDAIPGQLAEQGSWSWLVPCFLALAVASLWVRHARPLAAFYLGTAGLMTLGLLWVFWTGNVPIDSWLISAGRRVVAGVVLVCGVGLVHLLAVAEPSRRAEPAASRPEMSAG